MSYDIELKDPVSGEIIQFDFPHQMRGGNYVVGGTTEARMNITYNYSRWYYKAFGDKGIRTIYEMTGTDSIPVLENAITFLKNLQEDLTEEEIEEYKNHSERGYWMPARENAIKPLYQLLAMAKMRSDGVWDGD